MNMTHKKIALIASSSLLLACMKLGAAERVMDESTAISSTQLRVLNLSLDEAKKKIVNVDGYSAKIFEDDGNYYVAFVYGSPKARRGNTGEGKPGIEVIIQKKSFKVLKSYFLR